MKDECRGQSAECRVESRWHRPFLTLNSAFCTLPSALILALLIAAPALAQDWLTVHAGNFEVYTNAGAERATATAQLLERMRVALAAAGELDTTLTQPVRVYVFKTKDDYRHYGSILAGEEPGKDGMSVVHRYGRAILLDGSVKRLENLVQHELAHLFVRQNYGDLPLWLDEGLAEFYAYTKILPELVELGRRRRRGNTGAPVPLDELLAVDKQSHWYVDPLFSNRFYGSAWLLVNWLKLRQERDMARLIAELAQTSSVDAVQHVFGMTPAQLQRALLRYHNLPALPTRVVKIAKLETAELTEPRPVTEDEKQMMFTWTAPVPLVVKQLVVVDRNKPEHLARYDEAVRKVSRGELAAALEILDALVPELPAGELQDNARKLRTEVVEIMRKNRGGAR